MRCPSCSTPDTKKVLERVSRCPGLAGAGVIRTSPKESGQLRCLDCAGLEVFRMPTAPPEWKRCENLLFHCHDVVIVEAGAAADSAAANLLLLLLKWPSNRCNISNAVTTVCSILLCRFRREGMFLVTTFEFLDAGSSPGTATQFAIKWEKKIPFICHIDPLHLPSETWWNI